ncbi:MAG: glycosyltransferase family 39 protein [Cyanobacteria bacterium J06635_1]
MKTSVRMPTVSTAKPQYPWIPITLILFLSTGLGFYKLGAESFWIDELYSIYDATSLNLTLSDMLGRFTQIRPIYYILLRIWMLFGEGEAWLRSLSVLFGIGSVFLTYRLGRRIAGEKVGLLASLMLSLSPLFIHFSQMVRMYALGLFLALLGSLALAYALETPKQKYLGIWAITRALTFLAAPLNATLLFPDIILFGLKFRKQPKTLVVFGKWLILIVLACLPSTFALVSKTLPFLKKSLDITNKVTALSQVASPNEYGEFLRKFKKLTAFPFPSTSKLMSLFFQAYNLILLALAGLAFYKNRFSNRLLWVTAWAFVPWLIHAAVSKSMFFDRYIVYTMPYLLILIAAGLVRMWKMHRMTAALVAAVYAIAVTAGIGRYYMVQDRQDWRGLSEVISQHEQPGDIILHSLEATNLDKLSNAFGYYYKGDALVTNLAGFCETPDIKKTDATLALENIPPIVTHLWLVCGSGFDEKVFQETFGEHLNLEAHWKFVNHAFYRQEDYMELFKVTPKLK